MASRWPGLRSAALVGAVAVASFGIFKFLKHYWTGVVSTSVRDATQKQLLRLCYEHVPGWKVRTSILRRAEAGA